jgi:hypothetical protein
MREERYLLMAVTIVLAALVGGTIAAHAQVDDHTILYYSFDQIVGGKVPDEVGGYDGELGGDATITKSSGGKFKEGLKLDGDGDYMKPGNIGAPEEGTIETWVRIESFEKHNDGDAFASMGKDYGGTGDVMLFGVHQKFNLNIQFGMYSGGWKWADSGVPVEDLIGRWHHLAGTWGPRGLEIWIDGELKGTNDAYKLGIPDPAYQTLLIGANSWHGDIHGVMDGFRVSDIQRDSGFLLSIGVEPKGKVTTTWCSIKNQQ